MNSQVTSDQAAIAQLRALLSHAGSVSDLLNVQNQINDEETALEALQAQQRALSHETTYATVTLTILGPKAKALVSHHPKPPPSLAGGSAPAGTRCGSRCPGPGLPRRRAAVRRRRGRGRIRRLPGPALADPPQAAARPASPEN